MNSTHYSRQSRLFGVAMGRIACLFLVLFAAFVCVQNCDAAKKDKGPAYELVVLDEGGGYAHDIQQQDGVVEIVGQSALPDRTGVYWLLSAAGETVMSVNLSCPAGHLNGARAINSQGVIVGWQWAGVDNSGRPVIWRNFASDPLELPVPDGFVGDASASDVNDNLLVVGNLTSSTGERSIVAWQVTDVEGDLVATDPIVVATDTQQSGRVRVNNEGYFAASLGNRAYRWQVVWHPDSGDSGGLQVISSVQLFDAFSYAGDINEAGTVCGSVSVFGGGHEAFAMKLDGSLLELPLLKVNRRKEWTENVRAGAINDAGQVVGEAYVFSQRDNQLLRMPAVLWNIGEPAVELPLDTRSAGLDSLDDEGWAVGSDNSGNIRVPILLRSTR